MFCPFLGITGDTRDIGRTLSLVCDVYVCASRGQRRVAGVQLCPSLPCFPEVGSFPESGAKLTSGLSPPRLSPTVLGFQAGTATPSIFTWVLGILTLHACAATHIAIFLSLFFFLFLTLGHVSLCCPGWP